MAEVNPTAVPPVPGSNVEGGLDAFADRRRRGRCFRRALQHLEGADCVAVLFE